MKTPLLLALLVPTGILATSMEPPEVQWEKLFPVESFLDICESAEKLAVGSYDHILLLDQQGNQIWDINSSDFEWHYMKFQSLAAVREEGIVSTGVGKIEPSSSYSLFLALADINGNPLWCRNYDIPDSTEYGYSVISLPDSGYAIAGRRSWDAWILRTDSQGDTLWTREWGWINYDAAIDILYIDDGLTVFAQGSTPSTPGGPHLLRYDMDGNLLWAVNFPEWPGTVTPGAQTMCEASDGGLLLMDNYWPTIMHTSSTGDPDWWFWPPGADQPYGYSLSTTMDGGILYGGEIRGEPDSKSVCGVIARFDSHGNELWNDFIYNSSCDIIYSAIQLSQGGYIAAGQANGQGYLIKYAPELGIEEPEPASVLRMNVSPNPCSSLLSVSFYLPEAGNASIRIFDLSGRLVSTVTDGQFPSGTNTLEWAVPEDVSSGCYLIQYNSAYGTLTDTVALVK